MTITISSSSGFDWALLVNSIIAFIAVAGFIVSIIVSKKTLQKTDKQLKQTIELFQRQIDFQFLEKKHNLFRNLVWFFNPSFLLRRKLSGDEIKTYIDNASLVINLFNNDDDFELGSELHKYTKHLSDDEPLPDYTERYKDEIKKYESRMELTKDDYILFAFCHHMSQLLAHAIASNSFTTYLSNEERNRQK